MMVERVIEQEDTIRQVLSKYKEMLFSSYLAQQRSLEWC